MSGLSSLDRNLHLIDDHIDIAVRIGALADSALVATQVGAVRQVVCGSPAYFAAHGIPKKPDDLSALTAVTFDLFFASQHWVFRDPKSKREIRAPVRARLAVNTAEAAIDGAAAGLGVTRVLSYQVAQAVLDNRIEIVLAEYEPAPSPITLIHTGQGVTPLKVRMALDFAAPTRQSGFDLVPRGRGPRKDRPMMIVDHLGVVHGGQERLVTAVDGTGIAGDRAADLLLVEKSQEPRIDVVGTPCRGFHPRFPVDTCRRTRLSSPSVGPSSRGAPRV